MLTYSDAPLSFVDRPATAETSTLRSFLEQVDVVELSQADIECLAAYEPAGGVYHRMLDALRSHTQTGSVFPVLVGH